MERQETPEVLVRLKLIGSIEAVDLSGKNVLPPSRKSRALLCYLALNSGQWVPRARITRLLWDRVPEEQGRASLRQALHELSRAMGSVFAKVMETERERLRLRSETVWVDALASPMPAGSAPGGGLPDLNVFSGSLLLDGLDNLSDEFDHWLASERQKFEERIRRWNETNIRSGVQDPQTHKQHVEIGRRAVAVDPTNEEAVRELMRALVGSGQRAQAAIEYERCRAILRSRLDIEPAPETQRLYRDLRRATAADQPLAEPVGESAPTQRIQNLRKDVRALLHIDAIEQTRIAKDEAQTGGWRDFAQVVTADVLRQVGGRVVESLGEAMLLEFADARSAAAAAFALQARSRSHPQGAEPGKQLRLRMGIEVGGAPVHRTDDQSVSAARLVTTLAGPGETVITANARDQLTPVLDADVEDLGDCYSKGVDAPVRVYRIEPPGPHPRIASAPPQGRLMPTIAVIPFAARMSSGKHDLVGEVLADELIRSLSRSQNIDVISRLSTTAFRGRAASIAEIGGHLNADYVLSGVYRTDDQNITLDLELSEVRSERIVWSERLSDKIAGVLHGEQELINRAVANVFKAILYQELGRARSNPLPTLESYTLLMGAIALMHRNSLRDFQDARDMLQAVVERASRQAIPNAWLANWHVLRVQQGWSEDINRDANVALDYSQRSIDADPNCSLALVVNGFVHTNLLKRLDIALERYDLAIQANPNDALAWLLRGTLHAFTGDGDVAVENTQRALKLTPLDPHRYYYDSLSATACLAAHQFERALELANRSLRANRNKTSTLRAKAVAQWQLGHHDAARATAQELLKLEPNLTIGGWLSRSPSAAFPIGAAWAHIFRELGIPN